jgi:hypothetical protein
MTKKPRPDFNVHPDAILPPPARRQFSAASIELEEPEETETVVVNAGHTIHAPLPNQRIAVGCDSVTGATIYRAVCKIYGPSESSNCHAVKPQGFASSVICTTKLKSRRQVQSRRASRNRCTNACRTEPKRQRCLFVRRGRAAAARGARSRRCKATAQDG